MKLLRPEDIADAVSSVGTRAVASGGRRRDPRAPRRAGLVTGRRRGSADPPFTTAAVLRTMAYIAPDHPVPRSMSAVYGRGGDKQVEGALYRSQYFDKLDAWGGGEVIANAARYVGSGFQLIAFDPKVSMAGIGQEAFASERSLREAADLAGVAGAAVPGQDPQGCGGPVCTDPIFSA